ncbi:uncharacterized protein J3D65DRAFT_629332 [Phyllosticta citribraziliensis]|uniref:Uncharacterized protein n=1 Tax=Phyllosticta citribraziliensis TaxID=989973 RepID=A0ABR1LI53_9PEZI
MLDENLPTFFLKASPDGVKHHQAFFYSIHGGEPEVAYSLRHPDPSLISSKNCYAAGLFDAFNPDVVYGETLVKPEFTSPTLSQDEIRRNGGVTPMPQPILPANFTIQLYDPDQQVTVKQKSGSWGGAASYEFSMPQVTFRLPSASTLDRTLNDPAADITTPKLNFVWRRESKLSKDLTCYMTGKSTDPAKKKKKSKEPDIAVALFRSLREVTVYESNLFRVEMEDPKGLEVVLLLSAAAIRDIYFGQINQVFNVSDPRKNSGAMITRKKTLPLEPARVATPAVALAPAPAPVRTASQTHQQRPLAPAPTPNQLKRQSLPPINTNSNANSSQRQETGPRLDPRAQWELDNETRRIRKMVEAEEKQKRKKDAQVSKETERLRRKYGTQENLLAPKQQQSPRPPAQHHHPPPGRHAAPTPPPPQHTGPFRRPHGPQPQRLSNGLWTIPQGRAAAAPPPAPRPQPHPSPRPDRHVRPQPSVPLRPANANANASSNWHSGPSVGPGAYFGGGGLLRPSDPGRRLQAGGAKKSSFFGLRTLVGSRGLRRGFGFFSLFGALSFLYFFFSLPFFLFMLFVKTTFPDETFCVCVRPSVRPSSLPTAVVRVSNC